MGNYFWFIPTSMVVYQLSSGLFSHCFWSACVVPFFKKIDSTVFTRHYQHIVLNSVWFTCSLNHNNVLIQSRLCYGSIHNGGWVNFNSPIFIDSLETIRPFPFCQYRYLSQILKMFMCSVHAVTNALKQLWDWLLWPISQNIVLVLNKGPPNFCPSTSRIVSRTFPSSYHHIQFDLNCNTIQWPGWYT